MKAPEAKTFPPWEARKINAPIVSEGSRAKRAGLALRETKEWVASNRPVAPLHFKVAPAPALPES